MEETKVVERVIEKDGGGAKVIGIVAIIIAIIALVVGLSGLGVKSEVKKVEKFAETIANKEAALELKATQMELISCLDRVYALTMVERDYQGAAVELAKAQKLLDALKGNMDADAYAKVEKTMKALKAEIDRGPSPIPMLIAQLRSDISSGVKLTAAAPAAEAEKEAKKVEAKKESVAVEKKVEIKRPVAAARPAEEEEGGLKKAYLFWKRLGESLVRK